MKPVVRFSITYKIYLNVSQFTNHQSGAAIHSRMIILSISQTKESVKVLFARNLL